MRWEEAVGLGKATKTQGKGWNKCIIYCFLFLLLLFVCMENCQKWVSTVFFPFYSDKVHPYISFSSIIII